MNLFEATSMRNIVCGIFASSFLLSCNVAIAQDRYATLASLIKTHRELHATTEETGKEYNMLLEKYRKLQAVISEFNQAIARCESIIKSAERELDENKRMSKKEKEKNIGTSSAALRRRISEQQELILKLKQERTPVVLEAEPIAKAGKEAEAVLARTMNQMWDWRNSWAHAGDVDLTLSSEEHEQMLEKLDTLDCPEALQSAKSFARAIAQAGKRQYDESLATLEPLAKDEIWKAKASSLRSFIYHKQDRESLARSEFLRILKLDNRDPHAFLLLGVIELQLNNFSAARRRLEHSLTLSKTDPSALSWLALSYALDKKSTPAELLTAALAMNQIYR
jgi:Flp pilus assembly protein TadD